MKKFCVLLLFALTLGNTFLSAQNIIGSWQGELSVQGTKLPLVFNIKRVNDSLNVTMDSPMQKTKNIPTTYSKFENNQLSIKAIQLMLQYHGQLINDSVFEGTFIQGGTSFPLKLTRGTFLLNPPQEPQPPFPYNSEDVVFENKKEGFELAGTFSYPREGQNFPAVILITGSGPQNRDEEILGHKPFLIISDYLTRKGIAVLRFDDRGVGQSKGDITSATTKDLSVDVRSAFEYLKTREEVDPTRIGLLGHSEGGCIAFMLAAEYDDVSFIVSMAGGAIRGDSLLKEQRYLIGITSGQNRETLQANEQLILAAMDYSKNKNQQEISEELDAFIDSSIMPLVATFLNNDGLSKGVLKREVLKILSPWMQYFMKYDPSVDIRKIKCPIFALNGNKDLQVKSSSNLSSIKSNAPHAVVKEYENLNHLFQTCNTGLPSEYGNIEETIAPQVLKDISDWINQTVK